MIKNQILHVTSLKFTPKNGLPTTIKQQKKEDYYQVLQVAL